MNELSMESSPLNPPYSGKGVHTKHRRHLQVKIHMTQKGLSLVTLYLKHRYWKPINPLKANIVLDLGEEPTTTTTLLNQHNPGLHSQYFVATP